MENTKKKLNILVDSSDNRLYKEFLSTKYDVNMITVDEYDNMVNIDFLLFTGGEDVSPNLYGENVNKYTNINKERDRSCKKLYEAYKYLPKLGICRGSQFLTAMSGGRLIQHVEGHMESHIIVSEFGSEYTTTSDHHQMMFPYELNKDRYKILAYSKYFKSHTYLDGNNQEFNLPNDFLEPEIVFYENTNSLCIQGHPEYAFADNKFSLYCLNLIDKYIIEREKKPLSFKERFLIQ